jgi:hypothetical protein
MANTFTQNAVNGAVQFLMNGGPGSAELTASQYHDMIYMARTPQYPGSILSDFAWCLQLAIVQGGHSALANSKNICRDSQGALADSFQSNPTLTGIGGIANNELQRFAVSISG